MRSGVEQVGASGAVSRKLFVEGASYQPGQLGLASSRLGKALQISLEQPVQRVR